MGNGKYEERVTTPRAKNLQFQQSEVTHTYR